MSMCLAAGLSSGAVSWQQWDRVLCFLAQTAGTALLVEGREGNPLVCFASNLCLAASFLKELHAAKLVLLTASSVVYLAVK